jgi:hypothetical protein
MIAFYLLRAAGALAATRPGHDLAVGHHRHPPNSADHRARADRPLRATPHLAPTGAMALARTLDSPRRPRPAAQRRATSCGLRPAHCRAGPTRNRRGKPGKTGRPITPATTTKIENYRKGFTRKSVGESGLSLPCRIRASARARTVHNTFTVEVFVGASSARVGSGCASGVVLAGPAGAGAARGARVLAADRAGQATRTGPAR